MLPIYDMKSFFFVGWTGDKFYVFAGEV
jgi:hypothetical protein